MKMKMPGIIWFVICVWLWPFAFAVVVRLSTLTEFHFDQTLATFGPSYGAGISGRLVLAYPLNTCLPNGLDAINGIDGIDWIDGSSWLSESNGSIVVFRADCCHSTGNDPVGDCFYAQRSILAQLYHASAAIIANCDSQGDGNKAPIEMGAPALPLAVTFAQNITNVTQITIPTVSVGCDFIAFVSNQTGQMWATIDSRDEVEIFYGTGDSQTVATMPLWGIVFIIFFGVTAGIACVCLMICCKSPRQNPPIAMASVTRIVPMTIVNSEPSQSTSQASRNL